MPTADAPPGETLAMVCATSEEADGFQLIVGADPDPTVTPLGAAGATASERNCQSSVPVIGLEFGSPAQRSENVIFAISTRPRASTMRFWTLIVPVMGAPHE